MWLKSHLSIAANSILVPAVVTLLAGSIILYKQNVKLAQELEMAQNNVEAYQGALDGSQQAFNVLKMDMETLSQQNDILLQRIDSVRKANKIKPKQINVAATQSQVLTVNAGKKTEKDIITVLKDTTYQDSLFYNPLTKVYYTIGRDSVDIKLDVQNTQYLYIYSKKEYKNKKNFFNRLFTLDFKKVRKYKYQIINTNDLLKEDSIRIIENK